MAYAFKSNKSLYLLRTRCHVVHESTADDTADGVGRGPVAYRMPTTLPRRRRSFMRIRPRTVARYVDEPHDLIILHMRL